MSSAASAANQAFGIDRGLPFPLSELEHTDVLVLVGSNLAETMPPAARHLDRLRKRGGRVVVIDPRRTATVERADVFLQPVPATDLPIALGLLHLLDAASTPSTWRSRGCEWPSAPVRCTRSSSGGTASLSPMRDELRSGEGLAGDQRVPQGRKAEPVRSRAPSATGISPRRTALTSAAWSASV